MILDKKDSDTVKEVSQILEDGGICVLPCDTIYGLSSIYGKGEAALKALKGRDAAKPFIVLATIEQAKELCESIPQKILSLWPAPLTAILKAKKGGTIGVRVPDDPFLVSVLNTLGSPVYSTSVNMSGEPSLLDFKSICEKFGSKVDVLVKGMETQGTTASTIVDATTEDFKILRQGSYRFI